MPQRPEIHIRELQRQELPDLWSIDRSEVIETIYRRKGDELVAKAEHYDLKDWPAGEPEHYGPILLDCFDSGGTFYGAFVREKSEEKLIGAVVLESRFIGRESNQLQLKFLHVSRASRQAGLGCTLFEKASARAIELGARQLYISATPSENTLHFYQRRGCRLAEEVDEALFELEPEDIHLVFDLRASDSAVDPVEGE